MTHDPRRIEELIAIVLNHEDYRSDFDMQGLAIYTKQLIQAVREYFDFRDYLSEDTLRALVPDKEEGK